MKNYLSGMIGARVCAVKKQFKGAVFAITLGAAIPATSQAIELENPNMCSSGITNMMSDMGLMAYSMANFMNGFCKSMPFFGMFCPDLDKMAGSFFSKVLQSPDLTLDMLACADQNPSMLSFMLHVIDKNPGLLSQMGNYMGQTGDGSSKGCTLGANFTAMATRHSNLKNFFLAKINEDLYVNYADNVFYCETDVAVSLSEIIRDNPSQSMNEDSNFGRVLRSIHPAGTTHDDLEGHDHTLHVANERMFYSLFSNVQAGLNFMDGLSQIDSADQQSMLEFMFLGRIHLPEKTCQWWDRYCTPQEALTNDHPYESTYYMYSMIQAMADGILPVYQMDADYPPVPDSSIPANALFGQFLPLMLDENMQINEFGLSFFRGIVSGAFTHKWDPADKVMKHMVNLIVLQQVPFTFTDLGALLEQLNDPCSADPSILFAEKDDNHHGGCGSAGDGGTTSPTNTSPSVAIDSPSTGSMSTAGEVNAFAATASDNEDGAISENVQWSSNIDGSMGQGAIINVALTAGVHTITASITDSNGATSTATVNVTMTPVIGENIAPNANVSASSTYMSYYSASKINDGDKGFNNYWMSDYISYWNPTDEKVYLTWGSGQQVNEVTIHWSSNMLPSWFSVYALVNGSWIDMTGSMTVNQGSDKVYINVNTSKIYIKMGAPNNASNVGIHEVEVR